MLIYDLRNNLYLVFSLIVAGFLENTLQINSWVWDLQSLLIFAKEIFLLYLLLPYSNTFFSFCSEFQKSMTKKRAEEMLLNLH